MDSKTGFLSGVTSANAEFKERRRIKTWHRCAVLVILLGSCFWLYKRTELLAQTWCGKGESLDEERSSDSAGWKWSEIKSSSDLIWHRCYEDYDCTKLEVPLDWLDPLDLRRATIAIIRYNATDRTDYKGPVFINPGGPGGSGVWFIKHLAPYYQSVVGRNHDIISFDPRGVGLTLPEISCWNSSSPSPSSSIWDLTEPPVVDAHPGAIYDSYAHASAFSQQCYSQIQDVGRFVSTPYVARDLLHMIEKLGEPKLKYWGFSYGTFLGTTFAAMFPDKVGRMVNDGNVDARDYVSGRGTHFLEDTDKVMNAFYTFCHQAGPALCAFYASTPEAIESRLDALLAKIKTHPVIVPASSSANPRPEIVSYSKLRRLISSSFYRPLVVFPSLAEAFLALESGDGRPFIDLTSQGSSELPLCQSRSQTQYRSHTQFPSQIQASPDTPTDPENPTPEVPEAEGSADASKAILCSDGTPIAGGVEEFGQYVNQLIGLSSAAGATMSSLVMGCIGWKVRAKWTFNGPFEGNTSHPILFIANTADNVTPLRSALANAEGFPSSVVMVQDSYGHTSLACPSRCTARTIRSYFQTSTLPVPNTVCAADLVPFEPWKLESPLVLNKTASMSSEDNLEEEEERELDVALRKLMTAPVVGLGFGL